MCEYVDLQNGQCSLTKSQCPFMYYCPKRNAWRNTCYMTSNCNVKRKAEAPKGYCRVRFERKGYLYVDLGEKTVAIKNPFEDVPDFVKVTKLKNGNYRLKR